MSLIDAIILVIFFIGILDGYRKGALRSIVSFIGTILVVYLSYQLKGSVANILISKFPAIGQNETISVLLYNLIAFVLLIILLSLILRLILKVTKIIDKLLDATVILGLLSRLIGAVLSFVETYLLVFVVLYILSIFDINMLNNSKVNNFILEETPIFKEIIDDKYSELKDIYEEKNINDNLKVLLDKDFISEDTFKKLINKEN